MKVGAGGLQSLIINDLARAVDNTSKPRGGLQETLVQAQGQDKNQLKAELNRAVERLNHLAHSLNYPIQLAVKEPPSKLRVVLKDKTTGQERELDLEELDKLAAQLEGARGLHLDSYT